MTHENSNDDWKTEWECNNLRPSANNWKYWRQKLSTCCNRCTETMKNCVLMLLKWGTEMTSYKTVLGFISIKKNIYGRQHIISSLEIKTIFQIDIHWWWSNQNRLKTIIRPKDMEIFKFMYKYTENINKGIVTGNINHIFKNRKT